MPNQDFFELLSQGGYTIWILIVCSILSIKVIIEKYIAFSSINEKTTEHFTSEVKKRLNGNSSNVEETKSYINSFSEKWLLFRTNSPLKKVYSHILDNKELGKEDLLDTSFAKLDKEISKYERGLGVLATLGSISPFIGLFGTVIGIIRSFQALSVTEAANYNSVMAGIAEALVATAGGLFVAIPAVLFYNYFMKRLKLNFAGFEEGILEIVTIIKGTR